MMKFGEAISACFSKYADFRGRAQRSEFWFWQLFVWPIFIGLLAICLYTLNLLFHVPGSTAVVERAFVILLLFSFFLGTFLPSLAVLVRRLHDVNFPGFFILFGVIPFGALALYIISVLPGSQGPNTYGPDLR